MLLLLLLLYKVLPSRPALGHLPPLLLAACVHGSCGGVWMDKEAGGEKKPENSLS